jgi:hypothetical protein
VKSALESLERFIAASDAPEQSLVVVNRTEIDPVQQLLEETFAGQSVDVDEASFADADDDTVMLVRDGELVASSPLGALMNACLLVNGDLYRTGTSGIDRYEAPEVITALDETVFDLRGFPASNREKLVLIVVSRFIERLALSTGSGRLRATFQYLSRVGREPGTREVYRRLAGSGVETHVYGVDDGRADVPDGLTVHAGESAAYRESWCVSFVPSTPDDRHAALVALETGPNEWRGTWTYDPSRVREVDRVLASAF